MMLAQSGPENHLRWRTKAAHASASHFQTGSRTTIEFRCQTRQRVRSFACGCRGNSGRSADRQSCVAPKSKSLAQNHKTCGSISGTFVAFEQQLSVVRDLGDRKFLMLRNHGLLTAAPSIAGPQH
jgi:hypothetical protein